MPAPPLLGPRTGPQPRGGEHPQGRGPPGCSGSRGRRGVSDPSGSCAGRRCPSAGVRGPSAAPRSCPRALTCASPGAPGAPPAPRTVGHAGARRRGGGARGCLRGRDTRPGRDRPQAPGDRGSAPRALPGGPAPPPAACPPPAARPLAATPCPAPAGPARVPGEERRAGGARGRGVPAPRPSAARRGPGRSLPGAAPSTPARRPGPRGGRGAPRRPLPGPTGGGWRGGRAPEAVPAGWASWEWHGRVPGEARGPAGPPPGERAPTCRPLRSRGRRASRRGRAPRCPGAAGGVTVGLTPAPLRRRDPPPPGGGPPRPRPLGAGGRCRGGMCPGEVGAGRRPGGRWVLGVQAGVVSCRVPRACPPPSLPA